MTQFRSRPEEPKKEEPRFPKREEPKAEAKKPEAKEEPKKEEPPRRNRVTVLRDLVEDLESESNISEEQRQDFMQLNRRLTRALAR